MSTAATCTSLEPDAAKGTELDARFGVLRTISAGDWLRGADVSCWRSSRSRRMTRWRPLAPYMATPLVVSIAAGVRGATLARWLGHERIVRAMPNTPALIRKGITGAVALPGVSDAQRARRRSHPAVGRHGAVARR